ncbi:type IV toxin-antitoxin system AbiEi family antitoxin domain-containing protein [Verrucomicrobiota bacterium]
MTKPKKHNKEQLYNIAESQQGYFTTKQAKAFGYPNNTHSYHVQTGHWVREHRGIYRLRNFPVSDQSDFVLWSLWSKNRKEIPQGVFSHQTALSVYELSDIMPTKVHMTVPKSFRRNSAVPSVLILHYGELASADVEQMQGFRVTRPLRTLFDLVKTGEVPREILYAALAEALQRGLITRREIEEQEKEGRDMNRIRELLNGIKK